MAPAGRPLPQHLPRGLLRAPRAACAASSTSLVKRCKASGVELRMRSGVRRIAARGRPGARRRARGRLDHWRHRRVLRPPASSRPWRLCGEERAGALVQPRTAAGSPSSRASRSSTGRPRARPRRRDHLLLDREDPALPPSRGAGRRPLRRDLRAHQLRGGQDPSPRSRPAASRSSPTTTAGARSPRRSYVREKERCSGRGHRGGPRRLPTASPTGAPPPTTTSSRRAPSGTSPGTIKGRCTAPRASAGTVETDIDAPVPDRHRPGLPGHHRRHDVGHHHGQPARALRPPRQRRWRPAR